VEDQYWVETVLRLQYPGYLAGQIRPCWLNHPEARWELAWLYQLWSLAYLARRSEPKAAADWHDRWLPGLIRRLGQTMGRCEGTCQLQAGAAVMSGTVGPARNQPRPDTKTPSGSQRTVKNESTARYLSESSGQVTAS
jgi:hypothetical protein